MKKLIRTLLFLSISFLFIQTANATHLLGADISYECLGPGQYLVTLSLYRDCNGVNLSGTQTLNYSSSSCNNNSGSLQLTSIGPAVDITPNCPSVPSACGGNGNYGIEEWLFQGTLNLPPGCGDDWILGWSQCCRNNAITTLNGAGSQNMYVGSVLDNTIVPCNSSPEFNNAPGSIVCVNQPVVYNHGVSDADGDSLYFTLGSCYEDNNDPVTYNGGFNGTTPLTTSSGITVNPNTGAITFTPTAQQVGVLCVNVQEYRNGVLIGEINRDMQFTVIPCSNTPPQATGVNGAPNTNPVNFSTSVCANGDVCFTIDGVDPNANNVTMSWNAEIPSATFNISNNGTTNPSAEFCWNPGPNDIGQHFFTVNVIDDACPIIGQGTYTYIVDVTPSPNTLDAGMDTYLCFGESIGLNATSVPVATSYSWTPSATLTSSVIPNPIANPVTTTVYEVTASFPDGCDLTDVVAVVVGTPLDLNITPSNPFNCAGQNTVLTANSTGNIVTYDWTPSGSSTQLDTVSPLVTSNYTVEVTDNNGCVAQESVTVTIAAPSGNVCNVLYVTPTGNPFGTGSKASPLDLATALEVGACNGTTIKMAIGDYVTDTTINRVTSYLTLEGGFDPTINWDKVSTAGETRILRNATQTYSLISGSVVAGSGIIDEDGINPEVIAIEVSNQSEFRFQDITIETVLNEPPTETHAGYDGVDVYGVRLNTCDGYNVVRTQILADRGGNGGNQIFTISATNGGNSVGLQANNNGAGTNLIQSRILAGGAGSGGTGGGSAGTSNNIVRTGTNFVTNVNNFNLPGQPLIRMDDIACTASNITFESTSSNWNFGAGSAPGTANGASVITTYSNIGRKDITHSTDVYSGFANIILDSQVLPVFTTSAPFVQGQYRVCAGTEVNFTATNGGVGYSYHWDLGGGSAPNNYDGVNFETISFIPFNTPGIYTITLNFETNCCGISLPTTLDIYVEEEPNLSLIASSPNLCSGSGTPVTLTADDNINFGTISWSPSSGLDNSDTFIVNASPGDTTQYYVLVSDSTGLCIDGDTITVDVINLELSPSSIDASCGPNGSATITVTGGSGNYGYQWDDAANQTDSTATGLGVGTYNVMVTDLTLGCLDSATVVVNPLPGSLVAYVNNVNPVSCIGNADGDIRINVTGGTPPFDYIFSPAGGSLLATNSMTYTTPALEGGTYSCLVTDDNGCTYTVSAFIPEPDSIRIVEDTIINATCIGNEDGSIEVIVDGGVGPYTLTWDDPLLQNGPIADSLAIGNYCVTIVDASGCTRTECFDVDAPLITTTVDTAICFQSTYVLPDGEILNPIADLTAIDTILGLSGCDSIITTNITVNTLPIIVANAAPNDSLCQNDSLTLFGSGANSYVWDNGVTDSITFIQAIGTITYTVTGTDTNTCVNTATIDILVHPLPTVVANAAPNDTLCENDQVTLTGSGADSYVWDNGVTDGVAFIQAVGTVDYIVTGTDANGCMNMDTISVTVNALPTITANVSPNDTVCAGDSITLTGSGGASYVWDIPGVVDGTPFVPPVGSTDYIVTGTDANGCVNLDTITITVNPAPIIMANAAPNDTLCENEAVTLTGSGGITHLWNNGVNDGVAFVQAVGTTDYIVTGTDIRGCTNMDTISITVNPLPNVAANAAPNDTLCQNDSVTLTGSGANTYTWDNGVGNDTAFLQAVGTVTYTVTGTDTNTCVNTATIDILVNPLPTITANVSPNDTVCTGDSITLTGSGGASYVWDIPGVIDGMPFVPPVGSTDYIVTGTDVNGCVNLDTITITVNPAPIIMANTAPNDTLCENEAVTLTGSGGITHLWNNGVNDGVAFVQAVGTTDYIVTGTDIGGCTNTDTISITVNPLPNVAANAAPNDTLCQNDSVTLTGSGANTYTWDNGVGNDTAFLQAVGTVTYTVTGTDTNTCVNTATIDILVNPLPTITANVAPNDTVCAGSSITLTGSGGASYVWDIPGVIDGTPFVPPVGSTDYIVTGTDVNGCMNMDTITITVNALPSVVANAAPNDTLCENDPVTLTGSGTLGNIYAWDNGITDGTAFVQAVGTSDYILTGTDLNGCVNMDTISITVNALPVIGTNAAPNDTLCENDLLTLTGTGALGNTYVWDNGVIDGTAFVQAVGTTTYTVTGTDVNTCVNTATIDILVNPLPTIGATALPNDTVCGGEQITLSGSGGVNYNWDIAGVVDGVAFSANAGTTTYTVTGTDANGCQNTSSIDVFAYPDYSIAINVTICEDEQHTLPDGTIVNTEDVYTTTLTSVNGCDSIYTTTLVVNQIGLFTPLTDVAVCSGFSQELNMVSQNMVSFEWFVNDGSGDQSLVGNPDYLNTTSESLSFNLDPSLHNNVYTIQMVDECGRPYSSSMTLEVFEPHAVVDPLEDTVFCLHEVDIITVDYDGYDYEWSNGELGASILPDISGDYIVNFIENNTNCLLSDTINIGFEDCIGNCVVLAPTGFSPNASGMNDEFRVVTTCDEGFTFFQFNVYNRWGELMFATDDWREGWDGTYRGRNAEIGTYSYYVEYTKTLTNKKEMLKGNVTIIR